MLFEALNFEIIFMYMCYAYVIQTIPFPNNNHQYDIKH